MNKEDIKCFLPHRSDMLLIDEVEVDDDQYAHAKYQVTGKEFFLRGHFPGNPVVPGVILCEIMAQSSSLLIGDVLIGKTPFFAGIDKARFKKQVKPGDLIEVTAKITKHRGLVFFVQATAFVKEEVCAQSEMSFILVDNKKL